MTAGALIQLSPIAVSVTGLRKRYPGVVALDGIDLQFPAGEVTAVLGENGAGKSTLMTILAGLQRPDAGVVTIDDRVVTSFSPSSLLHDYGVALVPQEIALCRDRTVSENVLLGSEPGRLPSRRAMVADTAALLQQIDTDIDPRARVSQLSVAEQQLVLIVRALARQCRVLILDEPTTSLTDYEVGRLFTLLHRLRASGTTIIYVSHRLPEVFQISDQVHVLRDGRHAASFKTAAVTAQVLVEAMVGRSIAERDATTRSEFGATMLQVSNFSSTAFSDVALTVHEGETLGVAGLPDSGRSELVAALFGAVPARGSVQVDGTSVHLRTPRGAMRNGIGYVPAERRSQGVFPDMSVAANATILDVATSGRFGLVNRRRLQRLATDRLTEFDVRGSVRGNITGLSGGNQQKVILSRWLARKPRVLLLDDPTRGVDVGAKSEIHERIARTARQGAAIVMASSDLPELLRTCDRILVMASGRVAGTVDARTTDELTIMALATNTHRHDLAGAPIT